MALPSIEETPDFRLMLETVANLIAASGPDGDQKIAVEPSADSDIGVQLIVYTGQNPLLSVASLTRSSTTATCTTVDDHNYVTGITVTLAGVNEAGWDGDWVITVTGAKTFTFTVPGGLVTPATGTITATKTAGPNGYKVLVKDQKIKVTEITATKITVAGANPNVISGTSFQGAASSGDAFVTSEGGDCYQRDQYTAAGATPNVNLGDALNDEYDTVNKTHIGSTNEVNAKVAIEILTTAAATTTTLTIANKDVLFIQGTAIGQAYDLGDATTYANGKKRVFHNGSSEFITVVNDDLTVNRVLPPDYKMAAILEDNSTIYGIWKFDFDLRDFDIIGNDDMTPEGFTKPASMLFPTVAMIGDKAISIARGADYLRPTGKKYYVSNSGSDSNSGLTPSDAYSSVGKAATQVDVDEVIIEAGTYFRTKILGIAPTRDISFICPEGECLWGVYENLSWSKDGGFTNLYTATRTSVYGVRDTNNLNDYGLWTRYTEEASKAASDAAPGSFYTDGAAVWVHAIGSVPVDNTWKVLLKVKAATLSDTSAYFENITFAGGSKCMQSINAGGTRQRFGMKNCTILYSEDDNVEVTGNVDCVFENCIAANAELDGFNYHLQGAHIPTAIEVNCKGYANGNGLVNTNNGSTGHDAMYIARFVGLYYDNHGPNVIDVGSSFSWNVKIEAWDSIAPISDNDYQIEGDMWLDDCKGGVFVVTAGTMYATADTRTAVITPTRFARKRSGY